MATSDTEICNMALGAVGARATIANMTEGSTESNACALHFENVRESLLQAIRWNFARKQAALSLLRSVAAGQTVPVPWNFEYSYPSDCIQCRFIIPSLSGEGVITPPFSSAPIAGSIYGMGPAVRWLIGVDRDNNNNEVKVILTDQAQAIMVYTYRCKNPNLYDAQFVTAFVGALAARICIPVSGDKKLAQMAIQQGIDALKSAGASNGNEGITVHNPQTDWMQVRGYSNGWIPNDLFLIRDGMVT